MTDSLKSDPHSVLSCLRAEHIAALLEILRTAKVRQSDFVESRYRERALHFKETLQFLQEIGLVRVKKDILELSEETERFNPRLTRTLPVDVSIIDSIVESKGVYQRVLASYLMQFHTSGRKVICRPSPQSRLQYSGMRNLLMQFGIVSHQPADDTYVLHSHSAHLYFWAKNSRATSKKQILENAKRRDALGLAAEEIIFQYEKKRLGSKFATFLSHVSAANPSACYDIKSITINGEVKAPRFIEVKAVPAGSFQFFWSSAELEAASVLRESYYLYLLPVVGGGRFDITQLEIIPDPYASVYLNPDSWSKEERVIVCRRKPE